jgi:hypothetical protein
MGRKRKEHINIDNIEYKYCSKCEQWKTLDSFYLKSSSWDKLMSTCKECDKERIKAYRKTKRGKQALRHYWLSEKGKERCKRYRTKKWKEDPEYMIRHYEILRTYSVHEPHRHFLIMGGITNEKEK